jgi:ankyrin repeat protein
MAAMMGRHENIEFILKTSPLLINARNKKSMTAIAYACKYGHVKAVEVLL